MKGTAMNGAMRERFPTFGNDVMPDCDALVEQVLLRKGTPRRVHHMELFHDADCENAIIQRFDLHVPKCSDTWDEHARRLLRTMTVNRFLGLDYVPCQVGGLDLVLHWDQVEDTAAPLNGSVSGTRGWVDEHKGPITSWEEFEKYPWPDVRNVNTDALEKLAALLPEGMGIAGRGGHWCENLVWLMGYETLCYALYDDRELVLAIREKIDAMEVAVAEALLSIPQVKFMWASDDLGFRTGLLISPNDTRELVLSGHQKIANMWHDAGRPYVLHACGKRTDIIRDLIETTCIDAIHSFEDTIEQVTDAKRQYGAELSVIGGMDLDFMCRSDEKSIRQRVRETLDVCQSGGGYALGTGNTVANYIPIENYLAMVDEGRAWGM